ncbi:MAG: hypothetical protein C4530_03970 [Desulfobacteraceae bacterium]|nr:MAG: hypothetical protein C4530_03970 [Desulfobacteraceae bacterium]
MDKKVSIRSKLSTAVFSFALLVPILCNAGQNLEAHSAASDIFIDFGKTRYAIVVEKQSQTLFLFTRDGAREVLRFRCSTGEEPGPKSRSGDSKTPEGVYFFTREHPKKDLAPIYGTRAYPIDYPNALDRLAGRDGNSIWLHGTNKTLKPQDTNGCVALENENLDALAGYITLRETPMIIVDRLPLVPAADPSLQPTLNRILKEWTLTLQTGSYHQYLAFYDPDYLPEISWWPEWQRFQKESGMRLSLESDPISIFKYNDIFVILFDQTLRLNNGSKPAGRRKLYVRRDGGVIRIIGDEYLLPPDRKADAPSESPLIAAFRDLHQRSGDEEDNIEEMIAGWLKAWTTKDIEKFGACYSEKFRSDGMNRRQWIQYKERLNKKYAYIDVKLDNLRIRKSAKRSTATFLQTYEAPGHRAVGTKELILVRENGIWKILREIWRGR